MKKSTHGGQRPGSGRPKTINKPRKKYTFELFVQDMEKIKGNKTAFVRKSILDRLQNDFSQKKEFWARLRDFVEKVQVNDPMSEEEKFMILDVCSERLK